MEGRSWTGQALSLLIKSWCDGDGVPVRSGVVVVSARLVCLQTHHLAVAFYVCKTVSSNVP
jgi:hypothetical protein